MFLLQVIPGRPFCAAALLFQTSLLMGQAVPSAGLRFVENIAIPNWSTRGASYDLFAFNPQTRTMYVADRTNHAVTAIDTKTDALTGVLPIPGGGNTNGVLIAPELQQLIVTDGKANVFVYDLRIPGNGPDAYVIPGITGGTDALDYNPLNHTVYVINGARNFMTGIDLVAKKISTQAALPGSPELMRWNPVDGLIYQVLTAGDNGPGVAVFDPVLNSVTGFYATPNCVGHGIEIDAPANNALIGCGTNQGQVLMNLKDGTIMKTFTDVTGADLLAYSPNNRRFYTGTGGNKSTTTGCPSDSSKTSFPIIGVISPLAGGSLAGVLCAGRGSKGIGVDPIQNLIYVGSPQYPADPGDANTGVSGVQVFADPAPAGQPLTVNTQATLAAFGTGSVSGILTTNPMGRNIRVNASLKGVNGIAALISITTTVGNEVMECSINYTTGSAGCGGTIIGDPLIGGVAMVAVDGVPVARGTIAAGPAMP